MKKVVVRLLVLWIIFMTMGQSLYAQKRYLKGDTLYVWSRQGLFLRNEPNGNQINSLQFSTLVIALEDEPDNQIQLEVIKSYESKGKSYPSVSLQGNYVNVQVPQLGQAGYVFDAYISKYPPILELEKDQYNEGFHNYFSKEFGLLKEFKNHGDRENLRLKIIYGNGINYNLKTTACCSEEVIIFPDMKYTEAYIILNTLFEFEEVINKTKGVQPFYIGVVENYESSGERKILINKELFTYGIHQIENYTIVTIAGGD
ncbi:hypothetical protein [Fulvivirga sp.]|uniref:hypothetical protein n=1 Tax=Fulvivirga sp. TaxID=1931237 RepID=UPI0032EF13B7